MGCPPRVRAALEAIPGVERVVVNYDRRRADVYTDGAAVEATALVAALARAGFPGSTVAASTDTRSG